MDAPRNREFDAAYRIYVRGLEDDKLRLMAENLLPRREENHENYTGNRSFRTLRGLDSITQLRGLKRLEIFDYKRSYPRATIRDRTFLEDTRRQVYSPKSAADKAKANLKSLKPLWRCEGPDNWVMSEQVRMIIHGNFDLYSDGSEDEAEGDDLDDDNDGDAGDNPGDDNDDHDHQGGNNDQSQSDDSHSDSGSEDDDGAPDHGANVFRAAPTVSRAGNSRHGGDDNDHENNDDNDEMDGLEVKIATKPDGDSDDGFELVQSEKPAEVKVEDEDDFAIIGSAEAPEVEFIRCVKRPNYIDLTQLPDVEDPDTVFPSVEEDEVKEEVKEEGSGGAGSVDAMESIPVFEGRPCLHRGPWSPFGNLSLRRGRTDQSSLFVRQSPSSRRSFSSHFLASFGRPSYERKRSIEEDGDGDDIAARYSLRRRLSSKEFDDDEMQE